MREISPSDLILVGKVVRPHGIGGLVRVVSYADSETTFEEAGTVLLKMPSGLHTEARVLDVRQHKRALLMRFEGVDSISSAEEIRGSDVFVKRASLSKNDDEAFWFELVGLSVYLNTGEFIGKVCGIISSPAHDIYVVKQGAREYMIPGVHEVVEEIDLQAGRMVIRPVEGLLEINEV